MSLRVGTGRARGAAGGVPYDPAAELAQPAEMLTAGVELGAIAQAKADLCDEIHSVKDEFAVSTNLARVGGMDRMRDLLLTGLKDSGIVTQDQADAFNDVQDRLVEAGLMD